MAEKDSLLEPMKGHEMEPMKEREMEVVEKENPVRSNTGIRLL